MWNRWIRKPDQAGSMPQTSRLRLSAHPAHCSTEEKEDPMSTNSKYRKTYPISWDQLHRDSKALAWRLLDQNYFKGIIAITRGGMVPAAIIARELDIHLVDTICVSSYDWKDK